MSRPYHKPNPTKGNNSNGSDNKTFSPSPHKISEKVRMSRTSAHENRTSNSKKYSYHNYHNQEEQQTPKQRTQKKKTFQLTAHSHSQSLGLSQYQLSTHQSPEALREQNIYLMEQNRILNELVQEKNTYIGILEQKIEDQVAQQVQTLEVIEREKNIFLEEVKLTNAENNRSIELLKGQLQQKTMDLLNLEREKQIQISELKSEYLRENEHIIEGIVEDKQRVIQAQESEICKLRHQLSDQNAQIQSINTERRLELENSKGRIQELVKELEKVQHEKKMELSDQKMVFDNHLARVRQQSLKEADQTVFKYEAEIKRIKNLLNQKGLEKSNLTEEVHTARLKHSNELEGLLIRQAELENEISEIEMFYKNLHRNEILKQRSINELEVGIVEKNLENFREEQTDYEAQVSEANRKKALEISNLYREIEMMREDKVKDKDRLSQHIEELKAKLREQSESHEEETEALKVKLGQLRHADLSSLKQNYENQLSVRNQEVLDLERLLEESREKLQKQFEERALEHKRHQYTVDELRIRIGDLELQIATTNENHKEKLHSLGSQMEMTSMTLINESKEKEKYSQFNELQKKKLQRIIEGKDLEIKELNERLDILKNHHGEEICDKDKQIEILDTQNSSLNDEIKREKTFYEKELSKKDQKHRETKAYYEKELAECKQVHEAELKSLIEETADQRKELESEIQRYLALERQLRDELSIHREHTEQQGMEKEVTHNDEKSRLEYAKQSMEINLKAYYEKKLSDLNEELRILRKQLAEKNEDGRVMQQKCHKLEKKVEKLMESQVKMKQLEEKIMAMGQDNNIVKNLNDMVRSRRGA